MGLLVRDVLDLERERLELFDGLDDLRLVLDAERLGSKDEIFEFLLAPVRARISGVRGGAYLRGGGLVEEHAALVSWCLLSRLAALSCV